MSKGPIENGAPPVILSIQSSVAYGHVGNSAATFPLMRMGVEVWPVLTVHFSNHTGYPGWRGPLLAAADAARGVGPETVLVTSVVLADADPETMAMVAVGGGGAWLVATPRLEQTFTGAGDLTAAVFLAHLLRVGDVSEALASTAAAVFGVLRITAESGRSELALVQAQDELVNPSQQFTATQLR